MPITKEKLTTAVGELSTLAQDSPGRKYQSCRELGPILRQGGSGPGGVALLQRQRRPGQKRRSSIAGRDLEMAAQYLQHAANSAHFEFGPDTQKVITQVYRHGKETSETLTVDHNTLGMHLQGIEKAVKELGEQMVKSAKL